MVIFFGMFYYIIFCFSILLHGCIQLSRASSSSSLSSNDSGTPIDFDGPLDEPSELGYYNSNFQVLNTLYYVNKIMFVNREIYTNK